MTRSTSCPLYMLVFAVVLGLAPKPAAAISLAQSDTFQDGSTAGWSMGEASPSQPVNVPSGGPGGAGDHFLRVTSSGLAGPGGKMVVLSGPQWFGNYLGAGVNAITMMAANFGNTDLALRLYLEGTAGDAHSATAVSLPAGSGWTAVRFDLNPVALSGEVVGVLAGVTGLRLYSGGAVDFPPGPAPVAALLGLDNITAVPEPPAALLLLAGLGLAALRLRRSCVWSEENSP